MAGSDRTAVDAALAGGERIETSMWWDDGTLWLGKMPAGYVSQLGVHGPFKAVSCFDVCLIRHDLFPTLASARSAVEQAVREALAG